ncbi:MAG: hypothetical protein AAGJ09_12925 [Pseudomonadota bacterium]
MMGNACEELEAALEQDEQVEAVVFGAWGWGWMPEPGEEFRKDTFEKEPILPLDKRLKILSWEQAKPLMQDWRFGGGYGSPDCYATYIWTTKRVFFVVKYDGSTSLEFVPKTPTALEPEMFGGG